MISERAKTMENYKLIFNDFNESLEKNKNIDKEVYLTDKTFLELSKRSLKREQEYFKEENGILISDHDIYILNFSGVSFSWSYTNEENQFIYGGYRFNGFTEALAQNSNFWDVYNSINKHEPDNTELELLKKLNWFEKQAWGDDGKFGCFLREPGNFPPKIYFYDYGVYFPMELSLVQYFDAMIDSCAVRGWQYFYIDIPNNFPNIPKVNKRLVLQDVEFIVEMLPKLFPDKDFSYQEDRLKYLKGKLKGVKK
jgi:hypothetical protein